ncbi:hypothetical protein AAZX31_12G147700 [Glycine max]
MKIGVRIIHASSYYRNVPVSRKGYRRRRIQQARFFLFCYYACLFHYYLFLFARF